MYHTIKNIVFAVTLASFVLISISVDARAGSRIDRFRPAAASASSYPGGTSPKDSTRERKDAPDFTLERMNGDLITLSEQKGKVVVLNIWATWCGPCRKEIPDFIRIQEEMRDDGVLFIGVSLDEEGWDAVRPFAQKYQINYPLVVDDGSVFDGYGPFRGIPMTFIINKKGKLEYVMPGMVNTDTLAAALEKLASR